MALSGRAGAFRNAEVGDPRGRCRIPPAEAARPDTRARRGRRRDDDFAPELPPERPERLRLDARIASLARRVRPVN